jgi:chromosome segregation ATPase
VTALATATSTLFGAAGLKWAKSWWDERRKARAELTGPYEERVAALTEERDTYRDELASEREAHRVEVQRITDEHAQEVADLRAQIQTLQDALAKLRAQVAAADARGEMSGEIEVIRREHYEREIARVRGERDDLRAIVRDYRRLLDRAGPDSDELDARLREVDRSVMVGDSESDVVDDD